jgi:hypothetical protein
MIDTLKEKLTPPEQQHREEAFGQAHVFVQRAEAKGGVDAPVSKSFPHTPRRDQRRVDIEVHAGTAFVPPA